MEIKLYIGGIPADMDELSQAQLVGMHGDIATLKNVRDKQRVQRSGEPQRKLRPRRPRI